MTVEETRITVRATEDDAYIADCGDGFYNDDGDFVMAATSEFNARLIAAAPELLAALRDVLRIAKAASISVTGNAKRIERAEAAIARATGAHHG